MRPRLALALAFLLALPFVACGDDDEPAKACTPGQQVECACPGGSVKGAQSCKSDGSGYDVCAPCGVAAGGSGGGAACGQKGDKCGTDLPCCDGLKCNLYDTPNLCN